MASKTSSVNLKPPLATSAPRPLIERLQQADRVDEFIRAANAKAKDRARRRGRIRTVSLGVCVLAGFLAWAIPHTRGTKTFTTPAAQRTSVVLADGSQAELNANTELFADFRYGRRMLVLTRGEAFFSVASDPTHPFLVKAGAGTVRVIGTQFNVRRTSSETEVTLVAGRVAVEAGAHVTTLESGQQLGSTGLRTLSAEELEGLTAWRQGRLALRGLTLKQVVEHLSAYHGREITCAPEVAELRPGGSFALDDFPGFIEGLEGTLPIRVIDRGGHRYSVVPR